MALIALQHINIRCANVEHSKDFYSLLGLQAGPRPPFASRGYWMYLDKQPVVHLVQKPPGEEALGPATGELDHVAFEADDIWFMKSRLMEHDIPYRETRVPRDNSIQLFVRDPDGIQLELNFAARDPSAESDTPRR